MLVPSIFSIYYNVFYPIKERNHYSCSLLSCQMQNLSIWLSSKVCHLVKSFGSTVLLITSHFISVNLTHYQTTNFRLFQTERVRRRLFQIYKNGRKLSKQVENTVEKGEIARYNQFLFFPQCF